MIIGKIRRAEFPYSNILLPDRPCIDRPIKSRLLSDEQALAVYNDCKNGMSVASLQKKYGLGKSLITDIKFLRGSYSDLQEKYNIKPLMANLNTIPKEVAYEAYKDLSRGCSNKEVAARYGLGESTVTDIKFCRNSFSYLIASGCIPLIKEY